MVVRYFSPPPYLMTLLLPELLAAAVEREHAAIGVPELERTLGRTRDDLAQTEHSRPRPPLIEIASAPSKWGTGSAGGIVRGSANVRNASRSFSRT